MYKRKRKLKDVKQPDSQIVIPGILTESDIFRNIMSKMGRRGGSKNTPKQTANRIKMMNEINARKRERMREREAQK